MKSNPKRKRPAKKIGVIGLGNMGRGIVKNLIKAGNDVFVWDINEETRASYARTANISEPHDMARKCQLIIFVVPGSPEIDGMLKGKNSMLAIPRRGLVSMEYLPFSMPSISGEPGTTKIISWHFRAMSCGSEMLAVRA